MPIPAPKRPWRLGLPVLAAATILASTLTSNGSGAATAPRSGSQTRAAQASAPQKLDTRGYPRTALLYASGPLATVARYDLIVRSDSKDIGALRTLNPTGIIMLQPTLLGGSGKDAVHVTAPGGAIGWQGATDTFAGGKGLGKIRAIDPERDYLHNADGSLASVSTGYSGIRGWNLAAPPALGVPEQVAKVFAYAAKKEGLYCTVRIGKPGKKKRVACWSGVHSDNWIYSAIGATWFYGSNLDTDRNGSVDDDATLHRNWSNGLTRVGTLLRSYLPGMIVGGNGIWYRPDLYDGSDPKGWLKASNYTLVEHLQSGAYNTPDSFLSSARRWLQFADPLGQPRYMTVLQDATDIDGTVLIWPQGDVNTEAAMTRPDVLRSMRWGLSLSLMSGVYYEIKGNFYGPVHSARWWFDEFDGGVGIRRRGYLGQPLGTYRKLADGIYRRDFERGIAINNSSSKPQTIMLNGTFTKLKGTQDPVLNDGSKVSSVTVPAKDGLILLRG